MQEFDLAQKVLNDIIVNDVQFNEALRKLFQADPEIRPLRGTVAGLVGCELRHHLLFTHLIEGAKIEGLSEEEKMAIALALADIYFFKRISAEDIKAVLLAKIGEEKMAKLEPLFAKAETPNEFIPTEFPKTSNKYLSLRYNTPEWVLKIWQHFGYGQTYRILKANARQNTSSVRVRTSMVPVEEVLNSSPDFVKSPVEGILLYGGKTPLRKLDLYKQNALFSERMATKAMLDEYKIEEPKEAFVYNGNADSSIFKEVIETYQNRIGLNLGCPNVDLHTDVTRMIKQAGYKNINFFGAEPDSMEAAISRPQDLVIAAPNSSNFDLIRDYPDYLLHFKKDEMDALFAQEKAVLEGCSKFVAEKGTLIYAVYTISKKEGNKTVNDFLANHKEFHLVKEVQNMPFEEHATALYYAVMVKDTVAAKAEAPVGDLASLADAPTNLLTASPEE
ncbi:MAG: hypothetical protein K6G74_01715 [Bacilli bacterium]|nr:hypothetical protein [Bacilli bacterium]